MSSNHRAGAQRSEAARTAILEAAAILFSTSGYERLTMEGVATQAKVGKQTIYRWWPSKSALVAECLATGYLLPNQHLDPPVQDGVRADVVAWMESLVHSIQEPGKDRVFLSLVSAAAGDAEVARHFHERFGGGRALAARLQVAIDAGELAEDAPMSHIAESLIGAVMLRLLAREVIEPGFATELVDVVLSGLVRTPADAPDPR